MTPTVLKMKKNLQRGFSLIEIMVGIALSGILLTALVQILSLNKENIVLSEAYSQVQESGRLAVEMLSRDFRLLGYQGCLNSINPGGVSNALDTSDDDYDASTHDYSTKIIAVDNFSGSTTYGGVKPVAGSDVITSLGATSTDISVSKIPSDASATIHVTGPQDQLDILDDGMVLMVSDCQTADIFTATNVNNHNNVVHNTGNNNGAPDNSTKDLSGNYGAGDKLWIMNTSSYFIGPSQFIGKDTSGDGALDSVNSLYKTSQLLGANAVELVPYIESFQIEYGLDTSGNLSPDVYKSYDATDAAFTNFPGNLMTIKLKMTMQSDISFSGGDQLSRSYNKVIQIRNSRL